VSLWRILREDMKTVFEKDPAARSRVEILLCYPGLHALWLHRLAHRLWLGKHRLLARVLSHCNRFLTGIEIHPGARVGRRFFVDHGMGVVIGETTEIGDDVLLYKGVVLGGTTLQKGKRHPTIGNGVVIGSNAVVLGAIAVGDYAKIGSGAVVIKPVPPKATVVGVPGRVVAPRERAELPRLDLEHARLPDPVVDALRSLEARIEALERAKSEAGIEGTGESGGTDGNGREQRRLPPAVPFVPSVPSVPCGGEESYASQA